MCTSLTRSVRSTMSWARPMTPMTTSTSTGNGVQHTKSKFYTKNIKNKKAWLSTQSTDNINALFYISNLRVMVFSTQKK